MSPTDDSSRLPDPDPQDVSKLLNHFGVDGPEISKDQVERVYRELRQLAAFQLRLERHDHTLQPTALVNEAYIRLQGYAQLSSREHFLQVASKVMRQILVDYARARKSKKRGGENLILQLRDGLVAPVAYQGRSADDVISIDQALSELARIDKRAAALVELRFFGGLSEEDVCAVLKIAPRTARRDWEAARAMLFGYLKRKGKDRKSSRLEEGKTPKAAKPTAREAVAGQSDAPTPSFPNAGDEHTPPGGATSQSA